MAGSQQPCIDFSQQVDTQKVIATFMNLLSVSSGDKGRHSKSSNDAIDTYLDSCCSEFAIIHDEECFNCLQKIGDK